MYKPILNDLFKMENLPVSGTMETVPLDVWMIMHAEMQNESLLLVRCFHGCTAPILHTLLCRPLRRTLGSV